MTKRGRPQRIMEAYMRHDKTWTSTTYNGGLQGACQNMDVHSVRTSNDLKEFVLRTDKVKHLIQTRMLERKRKRSSHHEEMLHRFVVLAAQLGEDDGAWSNK
ncbi:hypothetical protein RRG08_047172 [Elysia crispata]|uniref:Uncharacterized protein n=1 Tax=Elysia crispata TaxID=231223 RepID=A0AAE0YMW6_9GAST|nr:hypothetical protein RRG08_047172 [Elysia crispata]